MQDKFSFSLSSPSSFEDIMFKSSSFVDDYTLGLQFPACDFGSYYLYATLVGDGPCQAINLGITVGHDTGSNVGIPELKGDPGKVWLVTSLICENISYRNFDFSSYRRADVIYSKNSLDLQVADAARMRGSWPCFEIYLKDNKYDIIYELQGQAGHAHWVPDHVSTTMAYSYLLFPDFKFTGRITVKKKVYKVNGIGSLDHVFGRNINNPTGTKIGFWHADPVMWDDNFASNGLYYLDDKGKVYIAGGVMTLPDGGYHPASIFEIEYLDFAEGSNYSGNEFKSHVVPRRWRAKMKANHGLLTYETSPVKVLCPETGLPIIEPCILSEVNGKFTGNDGNTIILRGKCYNEYEGGEFDITSLKKV